jgi:hypothetical protein
MEVQAHGRCPAPGLNGGVQGWQVKPGTARNDLAALCHYSQQACVKATVNAGTASAASGAVGDLE